MNLLITGIGEEGKEGDKWASKGEGLPRHLVSSDQLPNLQTVGFGNFASNDTVQLPAPAWNRSSVLRAREQEVPLELTSEPMEKTPTDIDHVCVPSI